MLRAGAAVERALQVRARRHRRAALDKA